jgi:hypothetical protein
MPPSKEAMTVFADMMGRLSKASAVLGAVVGLAAMMDAGPAAPAVTSADSRCDTTDTIFADLLGLGMSVAFTAEDDVTHDSMSVDGTAAVLALVGPQGVWALVYVYSNERACIVAAGSGAAVESE